MGLVGELVCFWFPAHNLAVRRCWMIVPFLEWLLVLWWVGCVVGLLFENYIVNASIFYKKAISLRK